MSKLGEPLSQDVDSAGFDKFLTRKYEGLGGEPEEQMGYSYDDLKTEMEGAKAQDFTTTIAFTSTDYRTASWGTGTIEYKDGMVTPTIAASNTGNMSVRTYIYYDPQGSKVALATTTTAATATQGERLLLAIAVPNANTSGKAEIQTFGATGMYIANLTVEHLTSGSIRSKTVTLAVTADAGDSYFNAGKTDFTNTDSGFILGIDDSDSDKAKFYIGDTTNYLNWTGSALSIKGTLTSSILQTGTSGQRVLINESLEGSGIAGIALFDSSGVSSYFYSDGTYSFRFDGGDAHFDGTISSDDSSIWLGGVEKVAIVPTTQGYRSLYCLESPEVWFIDFCESKEKIDPMFLEVTEGDIKFIQCDDGTYQIWRRRKGFGYKRFEEKTEIYFEENNKFWNTPENETTKKIEKIRMETKDLDYRKIDNKSERLRIKE